MELSASRQIDAPRDAVWAALTSAEVLQACIPGCEELIKHSNEELEAKVVLKVVAKSLESRVCNLFQ